MSSSKTLRTPHRKPLIPRFHLFELQDQPWFPRWFRERCQAALTITWGTRVPLFTTTSASAIVASILSTQLPNLSNWVLIDFCSGAGGPTPAIEERVNATLRKKGEKEALFVLTDIRPNTGDWQGVGDRGKHLRYERTSVDARGVAEGIIEKYAGSVSEEDEVKDKEDEQAAQESGEEAEEIPLVVNGIGLPGGTQLNGNSKGARKRVKWEKVDDGKINEAVARAGAHGRKKIFRMFSLSFHHFDDLDAKAILKDTVETSDGIGIFELQDRTLASLVMCTIFLIGIYARAIEFCWLWGSPMAFVFVYLCPIIPFTLLFDGIVSSLRSRTGDEVETLLRSCGADASEWEVRSGRELHFWPCGYVTWIVGRKRDG